jgi:hypothetical protein
MQPLPNQPLRASRHDERGSADRLESWKEIAAYLRRDVTTVQRWERREGMPVFRHLHEKLGSVYASRTGLDAWMRSRSASATRGGAAHAPAQIAPPRLWERGRPSFVPAIAPVQNPGRRNRLAGIRFQLLTDFGGAERGAAISRDGQSVAFLSDCQGRTDVWMTRIDTGQFCNLTRGRYPDVVDASIRLLGFSPDGAVVTIETLSPETGAVGRWAIPLAGGDSPPRPASESAVDWPCDASQRHAPWAVWAPSRRFVYFVQGASSGAVDLWRIEPTGGNAERMTFHDARVSHPVFIDDSTLLYLVGGEDGAGSCLRALDVRDRTSHPLGPDEDRYTSLAGSADGRRLAATRGTSIATLWRLTIADPPAIASAATPVAMMIGRGSSPRLGPGCLLYFSSADDGEAIWKLADRGGAARSLWRAAGENVELTRDARHVRVLDDGALVLLRDCGDRHNLWLVDSRTGAEHQLTDFGPGFAVHDFDVSSDGREIVVERVQKRSDIVLIDCTAGGD